MKYSISVYAKKLGVNWVKEDPNEREYVTRSRYDGISATNETIVTDGVIIDSDVKDLVANKFPPVGNLCYDNLSVTKVKNASFVVEYDRTLDWGTFYSLTPPKEGKVYKDTRRIPGINWPVNN